MIQYKIKPYTYEQAKKLNVSIFPSDNLKYKLELYDKYGNFLFYIGANGYNDYPTYLETCGKEYADERRRLYKLRHNKYRHLIGTKSYYADKLLW